MRIIEDIKLDFSDVLIVPKRSSLVSRKEVSLDRAYSFLHSSEKYRGIPIVSSNMDQTGTFEMANELDKYKVSTAIHKHYEPSELIKFFGEQPHRVPMFYTMGISADDFAKFKYILSRVHESSIKYVCIDVANGYSEPFANFVSTVREQCPDIVILAGNVVTPEMTEQLLIAGADIVKVGIGNGSVCTTRKLTGVGYPQLSAVMECADAAHGLKGHVLCDGGCQMAGDVAKAFGAGADFVMIGGMFAGHEECGGEKVYNYSPNEPISQMQADINNAKKLNGELEPTHIKFYGMSSQAAMEKYAGGVAEYRASEGKEVLVPYRGKIENTIKEILGGVRSCCTYVGAKTLKELPKRTTFIKVHHTHNTVFGDEQ